MSERNGVGTETPRTDEAIATCHRSNNFFALAELSRELERELVEKARALSEAQSRLADVEADREARRHSLAQEIHGCLKSRGFHSPGTTVPADLICAVGRALDGASEVHRPRTEP